MRAGAKLPLKWQASRGTTSLQRDDRERPSAWLVCRVAAGSGERRDHAARPRCLRNVAAASGSATRSRSAPRVGDFVWALGVSTGAGAIINTPAIRFSLGVVSFVLLLFLAATFARNAWRIAKEHRADQSRGLGDGDGTSKRDRGFLLGFLFVLTSPWGIGFWLAVIGSQSSTISGTLMNSIVLALAVVIGALAWATALCVGDKIRRAVLRAARLADRDAGADRDADALLRGASRVAAPQLNFEPITERVDREQMLRFAGNVFDLLPQLHDQLIERARGAVVFDAPHFVEQRVA